MSKSNVIDLKTHPLYIKKLMKGKTFSPFGAPIPEGLLDLGGFYHHYKKLEELNKQVDKLNKKIDKKLKKLEEDIHGKKK